MHRISFPQGSPQTPLQGVTFNTTVKTTEIKTSSNNRDTKSVETLKVDYALIEAEAVLNPTFHNWYAQCAYKLGITEFLKLASIAKQGDEPRKLFSYLLKLELSNR